MWFLWGRLENEHSFRAPADATRRASGLTCACILATLILKLGDRALAVQKFYVPSALPGGVSQPSAAVVMEQTTQSSTSLGHLLP